MGEIVFNLDGVVQVFRAAGSIGVGVWALLWLLRRGDSLQRENIEELRKQRDYWIRRAESAESELTRRTDTVEFQRPEPEE